MDSVTSAFTHIVVDSTVVKSVICDVERFVAITVVKLLVIVVEVVGTALKL